MPSYVPACRIAYTSYRSAKPARLEPLSWWKVKHAVSTCALSKCYHLIACNAGRAYYLGHRNHESITRAMTALMTGKVSSKPQLATAVHTINVDISAFCLSVSNIVNAHIAKELVEFLGLEPHWKHIIPLLDYLAHMSTFVPSIHTDLASSDQRWHPPQGMQVAKASPAATSQPSGSFTSGCSWP